MNVVQCSCKGDNHGTSIHGAQATQASIVAAPNSHVLGNLVVARVGRVCASCSVLVCKDAGTLATCCLLWDACGIDQLRGA